MIIQLIQHQMIAINNSVRMTIQAECITLHINNPAKLYSHRKPNQLICTQLVYLYTQTQLYKFIIISPNRNPCVVI